MVLLRRGLPHFCLRRLRLGRHKVFGFLLLLEIDARRLSSRLDLLEMLLLLVQLLRRLLDLLLLVVHF